MAVPILQQLYSCSLCRQEYDHNSYFQGNKDLSAHRSIFHGSTSTLDERRQNNRRDIVCRFAYEMSISMQYHAYTSPCCAACQSCKAIALTVLQIHRLAHLLHPYLHRRFPWPALFPARALPVHSSIPVCVDSWGISWPGMVC